MASIKDAADTQFLGFSTSSRVYVAGHCGLVGSAIVRRLRKEGFNNLILRTSAELDLCHSEAVEQFFKEEQPEFIFLAAAKVGGILANSTYPADFIRNNLQIQTNVIDSAYRNGAKKLLFLGSSCIYPKYAQQPMKEEYLLTGPLEPTNEWYAVAKIAGIKTCQAYRRQYGFDAISLMPTNLYGPNDNFDLNKSHVLPALIRKFHLARLALAGDLEAIKSDELRYGSIPEDILSSLGLNRSAPGNKDASNGHQGFQATGYSPVVRLWGSGAPYREFMHVDDLAEACMFLMRTNTSSVNAKPEDTSDDSHVYNVGVGKDVTIKELAEMVQAVVGFEGEVVWDKNKPDGTPRKLMDVSRLAARGWTASIGLAEGVAKVYQEYLKDRK